MNNKRQVRRLVERRFGSRSDIDQRYCEGSRSLRDLLEAIVEYELKGDHHEADFWRSEVKRFFPEFKEMV